MDCPNHRDLSVLPETDTPKRGAARAINIMKSFPRAGGACFQAQDRSGKKFKKISKKACKTQDLVVRYSGTTAKGENPPVLGAGESPCQKNACRAQSGCAALALKREVAAHSPWKGTWPVFPWSMSDLKPGEGI